MDEKSRNRTLAKKSSIVQWPKRSNKQPRGHQEDTEPIPPSPSAIEEDKEDGGKGQPHKPKRRGV